MPAPQTDEGGQVHPCHVHGKKERYPNKLWGIDAGMQQDSGENAPLSVVEDPGKDDCKCHNQQKKDGEVCEEGSKAGAWPSPLSRRQEVGQMPEVPQDTQEQGTPQRPIARLHTGQREAAPADFLAQRPTTKEDDDKGSPDNSPVWMARGLENSQAHREGNNPEQEERWNAQQG